jgi:hypothetical protein
MVPLILKKMLKGAQRCLFSQPTNRVHKNLQQNRVRKTMVKVAAPILDESA